MINLLRNSLEIIFKRSILTFFSCIKNIFKSELLRLFFGDRYYLRNIYDFKMFLNNQDKGISRSLILFGKREEDQKLILNKILKANMNVFDIGANIGYYVLIENQILKSTGKILAIEPNKENVELLKRNIMLNKIEKKRIYIEESGVSNKSVKQTFYLAKHSNLHTFHPKGSAKKFLSGNTINVKTVTISELSKKYFKPDLIRLDVEGHEVEILQSLIKDVRNNNLNPLICFEPHISCYNKSHDITPVLSKLFGLGYKTKYISSNAESGTKRIEMVTDKNAIHILKSDGEKRSIFENINAENTIKILTKVGGARTVLLSK